MIAFLTAETLPVETFLKMASPQIVKQGKALHAAGRTLVTHSAPTYATIRVEDLSGTTTEVTIRLYGPQVHVACSCRAAYGWGTTCRHGIASLLALRDYLREHPPSIWKAVLDQSLQAPTRRASNSATGGAIVFSLQQYGSSWAVVPLSIAAKYLPPGHNGDPTVLREAIVADKLSANARPMRSQPNPESYAHLPPEALTAASMAISGGGVYGSWYGGPRVLGAVLGLLRRCVVFVGNDNDPLQQPVTVSTEQGALELELERAGEELAIRPALALDGRRLPFNRDAVILSREPLWMLIDDQVLPVDERGNSIDLLNSLQQLRIPRNEQAEFFERYFLPLADRLPVRGDVVRWEEVGGPPEPRLYLSEGEDNGLRAELRFGYGTFELLYEKHLPATSARRGADGTFARIMRDLEAEQAAWQRLGEFGLKRGEQPERFLLRKSVSANDFLLRQVPRLAEAGYVIYGEEALTGARINRSRPNISLNIKSGIDWFDVEAVVSYGEQLVPLGEVRRAIRRRERFVKLADGSLGPIPEEWAERYRHLFGLAEEREGGLRLGAHHVGLLDQLLGEVDQSEVDTRFQEQRERLRSFEGIAPRPLPQGLQATLRPYQKTGYDWLHFLNQYGFGGCLADDMGVGKCQIDTSSIFVNGTLKTVKHIWERYAGPALFDGEGEWAEPTAPLLVNSIDERTGKIVQARVRRLYRQRVQEQLREVRLDDGSSITITRRHKLLGRDGWTNTFKPGDYICVPSRLVWHGQPVDPDLITLLAWQIAGGHELFDRGTATISQQNTDVLVSLQATLLRVSQRYGIKINQPSIVSSPGKTPSLRLTSIAYRQFLEQRGYVWGKKSAEKSIPDFIMQADDASVRLFLRHIFDAEGCAMSGGHGIEFSSASQILIKQVNTLLRRFGIWMRVHAKQKCATNGLRIMRTYYSGLINGSSARRFAETIGFGDPQKQTRLEAQCALPNNTNVEGVPASDIVGELVETTGLPVRHFGMHNAVYLDGSQQFSRASLGRVVASIDNVLSGDSERAYRVLPRSKWTTRTLAAYERLDSAQLQTTRGQLTHLLEQEVHYCRIEAVEDVNYDGWVYDLEVEQHHNFVAEGILCHNTIQVLTFLLSLREENPERPADLVVMPRSLLFNWQREAARFTPSLRVYVHADQGRISEAEQFAQHDLVLTTYGIMLRDIEMLRKYRFGYAVLDESQAIKNPVAETSRAARTLNSEGRLALTGTPVENTTLELWSQFAFLNPGLLGNLDYFRGEFVNPIERKQDDESARLLRRMVFPFILRRTKEQVALDLPPRSEEVLVSDMEPAQRKLYVKTRDYYRALLLKMIDDTGMDDARLKVLEGLLRLRQICNHPRLVDDKHRGGSAKLELLLETLDTLRAEGHKALVFSQFVGMLTLVREELDARGVPYAYLDGSTRDREGEVDRFQNDPTLPLFLISLKAGGVGLNLTAADYVIHIDPWWNPAVEMQATDRTHRIGQTRPVFVYKLIARESVEEKILQLQERKRALVEQLVSAEGGALKSLSRDDVEVLFT